jgi:hypothetical protein
MAKTESFQDLSLMPPENGQELWRWLYAELRAAILDGRLKRGTHAVNEASRQAVRSLSRNGDGCIRSVACRGVHANTSRRGHLCCVRLAG